MRHLAYSCSHAPSNAPEATHRRFPASVSGYHCHRLRRLENLFHLQKLDRHIRRDMVHLPAVDLRSAGSRYRGRKLSLHSETLQATIN